jgi:hypothetical protein
MDLSDIAAGLEVVDEQRERGVPTVDGTDRDLAERLADHESDLPCGAAAAAVAVEAYTAGGDVEAAAEAADVPPVTAARALHLLGVEGVSPLGPAERQPVREWLAGQRSRTDARAATGADERAFALAAFVEAREPVPGAREAVDGALDAPTDTPEALEEAMDDVAELL